MCNWKLLVLSYESQDGGFHLIPTSPLACCMVSPQVVLVNQYWQNHFVLSIEMSPPPISDVPWNQQLLTKQSPHHAEDARQRPLLGQSAGQQPSATGEGRRWGYKIKVIAECEESCRLFSISLLSIFCGLSWLNKIRLVEGSIWELHSPASKHTKMISFQFFKDYNI